MHTRTYPSRGYTAPDFLGTLWLCSLTPEHRARTCSYWYTVTDGSTAHTAFRTRAALMRWLDRRGLGLTVALPDEGVPSSQRLAGSFRTAMHGDAVEFALLDGESGREMSNGRYPLAVFTKDADGIVMVHTLNPNCERIEFDDRSSRALEDAGQS